MKLVFAVHERDRELLGQPPLGCQDQVPSHHEGVPAGVVLPVGTVPAHEEHPLLHGVLDPYRKLGSLETLLRAEGRLPVHVGDGERQALAV